METVYVSEIADILVENKNVIVNLDELRDSLGLKGDQWDQQIASFTKGAISAHKFVDIIIKEWVKSGEGKYNIGHLSEALERIKCSRAAGKYLINKLRKLYQYGVHTIIIL